MPVGVTADDGHGGTATADFTLAVNNVTPVVVQAADQAVDEGSELSLPVGFTDPGADQPWSATVTYGDGSGPQTYGGLGAKGFTLKHTWADDGNYVVAVTVTDKDNATSDPMSFTVTATNVAPDVNAGPDKTIDEGGAFTSSGAFTDPGADSWTATVDYDGAGGADPVALTLNADKSFSLSHTYAQDGVYDVIVTVSDDDVTSSDTALVTVKNVAPTLSSLTLTGATGPASVGGNSVGVSFSFTDPGANDNPWAIDVNWGDGKPHTTYNAATQGVQSAFTHTYVAGTYTITVTVRDKDGGVDSKTGSVSHIYNWTGFFSPVDNAPVFNVVKSGSAVPVKFSLAGNFGLDICASGYPRYAKIMESGSASEDLIEETVTAGGSSLSYGSNQYVYVWKTDKSLAGTCQQLQIKFIDGTVKTANFRFK